MRFVGLGVKFGPHHFSERAGLVGDEREVFDLVLLIQLAIEARLKDLVSEIPVVGVIWEDIVARRLVVSGVKTIIIRNNFSSGELDSGNISGVVYFVAQ